MPDVVRADNIVQLEVAQFTYQVEFEHVDHTQLVNRGPVLARMCTDSPLPIKCRVK
jgi:hypothetical protein